MAIQQILETNDAQLCVDLRCDISWRLPPKNQEEEMFRDQAAIALAKIAYDLQESVGHTILAVVKMKGEL